MATDRPAQDGIEVTSAMIDAGVDFYAQWDSDYFEGSPSPRYLVEEIFRRMLRAVSNGSNSTSESSESLDA